MKGERKSHRDAIEAEIGRSMHVCVDATNGHETTGSFLNWKHQI